MYWNRAASDFCDNMKKKIKKKTLVSKTLASHGMIVNCDKNNNMNSA